MPSEDSSRNGYRNNDCSSMDNPGMVYHPAESISRQPTSLSGDQRSSIQPSATRSSSFVPQTPSYGMQAVRSQFVNNGIPPEITDVIMRSWKPGTQKQYNVYIHKWSEFCSQRQIDLLSPTVNDVLLFLHTLYGQELSYSTLNTARSALSTLLTNNSTGNYNSPTTHPFIIRYLKGVFNLRKPTPRYSETWDVSLVLDNMKRLHPLATLSLKTHSLKLAMLLALTSGQRCQTLVSLDIGSMKKTQQSYIFNLQEHAKQNRPGNVLSTFCVRKYDQENLCPYRTLESYLEKTAPLRETMNTKLFLSYVKPHKAIGSSTVGRWIKQLLQDSGVDTTVYKAHSTRVASVSKVSHSLPTDTILRHVGWKSDCVFRRFYNKPIVTSHLFQEAVLQ